MEVASPREPWTAAVAWARPWHRPNRQVHLATSPAGQGEPTRPAGVAAVPAVIDEAWRAALLQLESAREGRAATVDDPDCWAAAMAQHAVHLAVGRVRALADSLELVHGHLAGHLAGPWGPR